MSKLGQSAPPAEVAAYDQAVAMLGPNGAALRLGDRFIVGRWERLTVGMVSEAEGGPILRGKVWGLVVRGEGASWSAALEAARRRLTSEIASLPPDVRAQVTGARVPLVGPGDG